MNDTTVSIAPAAVAPTTTSKQKLDFGNGRYSAATAELYHDLRRLAPQSFTSEAAEKIARDWASDMGRVFKDSPAKVKHGSTDKNGFMSLKEANESVKGIETRAMTLARFVEHLNAARTKAKALGNIELSFALDW